MPRSLRRLLDPQDHGSLEDITLHLQLRVLCSQPLELLDVAPGQAFCALPSFLSLIDPIAQGARVDPKVSGDLGDRLPGLLDDPDRSLTELPVILRGLFTESLSAARVVS